MPLKLRWPRRKASIATNDDISSGHELPIARPPPPPSTSQFQGLKIIAEGDDPVIDVVAIHGLNGHREDTWMASNRVLWLRDLLPSDLPRARILTWGYDANTFSNSRVSCHYLYDHACNLVSDLYRRRKVTNSMKRPIVFVAHSLGGIVLKSALIQSDASREMALVEHRSIKLCTYGIIFMGTPHQGGNGVQLGRLLTNIASIFIPADDRILRHLERDSEWLQQQLGQYSKISGDFVTKFAFEEYETKTLLGHRMMVVPRASAVVPGQADAEPISIHSDHVNMVKFSSQMDEGYIQISEHLQIMAEEAGDVVRLRWETQTRIDDARHGTTWNKFSLNYVQTKVEKAPKFVARSEELEELHKILGEPNDRRIAVLHGLGGMGKTQLAIEYIKRHKHDYSAIIWLDARDQLSLQQSFAQAAGRILRQYSHWGYLNRAVEGRELADQVAAVKQWLDEPRNDKWLLVYDNYDDPKFSKHDSGEALSQPDASLSKAYDIRPFFPESSHGAIVLTTRSSSVELGAMIQLGKLKNHAEGLEILSSTSGREGLENDTAAFEVAKRLDGLPLALSTAGAYLKRLTTSWEEYLKLYDTSWLRLQQAAPQLLTYEDRAMYSTWDVSYNHIHQESQGAATLLRLWAYFDNQDLWYELLWSGLSQDREWRIENLVTDRISFDAAIQVLCNYGLAEKDQSTEDCGSESRGYSVHGCVHSWMTHVLNENSDTHLKMASLACFCVSEHVSTRKEPEYWLVTRRLVRHADRCFEMLGKELELGKESANIYYSLGRLYADQERLRQAESMYERALQGEEKALGPDHTSTLITVHELGRLYATQGRLGEAESMFDRAARVRESAG